MRNITKKLSLSFFVKSLHSVTHNKDLKVYTTQNLLRITFFLVKYFCILRKLHEYFCVS